MTHVYKNCSCPERGKRGFQGPQGNFGTQGVPGPSGGPIGPQGFQGPFGGPIGPQGFQGLKGPQGVHGQGGFQGPKGPQGASGSGSGGSHFFFGVEPIPSLNPGDVFVDISDGTFYQHLDDATMPFSLILDDSGNLLNSMLGCAMSDDLQNIVVIRGLNQTFLFQSTNQGVSFTQLDLARSWTGVCCSTQNSGLVMLACATNDLLYVSTNQGGSFVPSSVVQNWNAVCMSQSGSVQMACANAGLIYTSQDTGSTWFPRDSPRSWLSISCSQDGLVALACTATDLFLSLDFGDTWTDVANVDGCVSVTVSGDGLALFAVLGNGDVVRSLDQGASFVPFLHGMQNLALSANQSKVLALPKSQAVTSYSQDGGALFADSFFASPLSIPQGPVVLTSDGTHGLLITINAQLFLGQVTAGNGPVFNSTVSDQAITSKRLYGMVLVDGIPTSTDTLLTFAGKVTNQFVSPTGASMYLIQGIETPNILLNLNVATPIAFTGGGPAFVLGDNNNEWIMDPTTGICLYNGNVVHTGVVTIEFALISRSIVDVPIYCRVNASGIAHTRVIPNNTLTWYNASVTQRMVFTPGLTIQLHFLQNAEALGVTVACASVNYIIA